MRPVDTILAKRHGATHSPEELEVFVGGYVRGEVPDYQVAAWLMAVCFSGMTAEETAHLTMVMAHSGDVLDLGGLPHPVDKHSTGGVGDKTSLVLAPLLAEAGATVAKMSGRGLGHTGGTVDKLESIPGFRSSLDEQEFLEQAREVGVVISGQSKDLAPADGLLYALRDATGTVDSLPLIASSIMSKKIAGGARSIVLDVKVGSGAFMTTTDEARQLARAMIEIGSRAGRRVRALLTSMDQPLGFAVGNSLEVLEAIDCLRGEGPSDLRQLCLALAVQVLEAEGLPADPAHLARLLDDGSAYRRFERWVESQGGDVASLDRLDLAPEEETVRAGGAGVVRAIDALRVGRAAHALGGGRSRKGDAIDPGVGVVLHAKVGDEVDRGEALATFRHRSGRGVEEATSLLADAFELGEGAPRSPLVLEVLGPAADPSTEGSAAP